MDFERTISRTGYIAFHNKEDFKVAAHQIKMAWNKYLVSIGKNYYSDDVTFSFSMLGQTFLGGEIRLNTVPDMDRVVYTEKLNHMIYAHCNVHGFSDVFFGIVRELQQKWGDAMYGEFHTEVYGSSLEQVYDQDTFGFPKYDSTSGFGDAG